MAIRQHTKAEIIAELKRVAGKLKVRAMTAKTFNEHSEIKAELSYTYFGSWGKALRAAGLEKIPPAPNKIPDDKLLREIIRLTKQLKKAPTPDEMKADGKYSYTPYRNRWGSYKKARDLAYEKYGFPKFKPDPADTKTSSKNNAIGGRVTSPAHDTSLFPKHFREPARSTKSTKPVYGEPMDFRGLRHAPINEQGVVYMFGMLSRELGFLVEGVSTSYPDCRAKRCVDPDENKWQEVEIEFEYKASNFKQHKHDPAKCDLVVCWINDDENCPLEVIELRPIVDKLKKE